MVYLDHLSWGLTRQKLVYLVYFRLKMRTRHKVQFRNWPTNKMNFAGKFQCNLPISTLPVGYPEWCLEKWKRSQSLIQRLHRGWDKPIVHGLSWWQVGERGDEPFSVQSLKIWIIMLEMMMLRRCCRWNLLVETKSVFSSVAYGQ